jgi:hypothetical protein
VSDPLRGHPGTTHMVGVVLTDGVFTTVTPRIAIYQDSGKFLRVTLQLTNTCNDVRRADAPGCVLPIDHPGGWHANDLGEAWKVRTE